MFLFVLRPQNIQFINGFVINVQKATRKTDKNRKEEVDVASLTDSELKDQLLKYGINPGPVVGRFSALQ